MEDRLAGEGGGFDHVGHVARGQHRAAHVGQCEHPLGCRSFWTDADGGGLGAGGRVGRRERGRERGRE
jgi:hypothetical protein